MMHLATPRGIVSGKVALMAAVIGLIGALTGRPASAAPPAAGAVSFSKEIAPLLVRSCGGCHIRGKKGDFHIPTFAALAQSGVVQPGVGQASRIVEVIASGDMPRGGGKVAAADLATLVKWIDTGAAYDGGNPTLPLASLGGQPRPAANRPAKPAQADTMEVATLRPGEVSFAVDVAPVLIDSCLACHGGLETESGFSMATFPRLLRGGGSGTAVEPGTAAESLLVKKIRGTDIDGQRMPLSKAPLPSDVIARIAKWIDEGARLDVAAAGGDLRAIAAAGRAMHLSAEELAAVRRDAAREYWRFLPDETPEVIDRNGLTTIGNLSAARAESVASVAETVWSDITKQLMKGRAGKEGAGASPVKGGITLYAFAKSYDLSEFWLVRHRTDRPRGVTSTAGIAGDVVYAAIVASDSLLDGAEKNQSDLGFTIAAEIGAAIFLVRGTPAWFAEGAGRVLAADAVPKAPLARATKSDLPQALEQISSAGDLLSGRADPQAVPVVSAAFLERLSASGAKLPAFLAALDGGADFDEAFQQTFRNAPEPLLEVWLAQEAKRSRRR
jgi:mono/diheme cytochrome c family protein